jgi:3-methyladenine DNA glycosylase AlkD
MKSKYSELVKELEKKADLEKAKFLQRFFKTGPGEYAEGDIMLGISIPELRKLAKKYMGFSLADTQKLLKSKIHDYRFTALEILVFKYEKAKTQREKSAIANFYLKNLKYINNWDLVDTSASYILGNHYLGTKAGKLYELAKSKNLWKKRVAIISTHAFIRNDSFEHTLNISEILLKDSHDLIHKAVGWMLREVGKRSLREELNFLDKHHKVMPRTTLRYAIERLSPALKKKYMKR